MKLKVAISDIITIIKVIQEHQKLLFEMLDIRKTVGHYLSSLLMGGADY